MKIIIGQPVWRTKFDLAVGPLIRNRLSASRPRIQFVIWGERLVSRISWSFLDQVS